MCVCFFFKNRKRKRQPKSTKTVRFDVVGIFYGRSLTLREREGDSKKWRREQGRLWTAKTLTTTMHRVSCSLLHTPLHCRLSTRCPDLKIPWKKSWEQAMKIDPKGEVHDLVKKLAETLKDSAKTLEESDVRWMYLQKQRELLSVEEYQVVQLMPEIIDSLETGEKKIIDVLNNSFNDSLPPCRLALLIKSCLREVQALLDDLHLLSEGATGPLSVKVKNQRKILRARDFIRFSGSESDPQKKEEGQRLEQMLHLLEEMNSKIYEFTRRRMNFRIFFNKEYGSLKKKSRIHSSLREISELETLRKAINIEEQNMRKRFCSTSRVVSDERHPIFWRHHWLKAAEGHFLLAKNDHSGHPDATWLSHWKSRTQSRTQSSAPPPFIA